MIRRIFWLAAALCCSFGFDFDTASAQVAEEPSFSVMTWNLEWFYDEYSDDNYSKLAKEKSTPSREQWDWRRDAIAESIARVSPSVVALQEVENRRVLWYLTRALEREQRQSYEELGIESRDHFTEQDVGFLFRSPVDVLSIAQRRQTRAMKASEEYFDLSKHLFGEFQIAAGDGFETVTILNIHLRAREEAEPLRRRQALLVHHWIGRAAAEGQNIIVLGDLNTEEMGDQTKPDSDVGILCGLHTDSPQDDLTDVTLRVPAAQRNTHLLGKQFDRILVSRSLLVDDPDRADLVFQAAAVRPDLAIRGDQDDQIRHWEHYWDIPADQRDLSDHYPVIATFQVK